MEAGEYDFSSIIGRVMKQVYERKVKTGNIDGELFRKTYEELNKKAAEGWGEDDYNDPEQAEDPHHPEHPEGHGPGGEEKGHVVRQKAQQVHNA